MKTFLTISSIFLFLTGCTMSSDTKPATTDSTFVDTLKTDSVIIKDTITIDTLK